LTLALRLFGPAPLTSKRVLATMLLVAAAGTVVGIIEIAAGAAYDYHLQSSQLQQMNSMRDMCVGVDCLAQQQHATLLLQVRSVVYGSGILLVTNLVLVGWVVAIRGGRLKVSATSPAESTSRSRIDDLRLLLVAALLGSAAIHAAVIPEHLTVWAAAGAFFILLAAAQLAAAAGVLVTRLRPMSLLAAAAISVGALVLWYYSRSFGLPFGPEAGVPEAVGLADVASGVLEVGALVAAVVLLRYSGWLRRQPPASAHVGWLALVAVIAVTAIGFAGSGLAWFDDYSGSGEHSASAPIH